MAPPAQLEGLPALPPGLHHVSATPVEHGSLHQPEEAEPNRLMHGGPSIASGSARLGSSRTDQGVGAGDPVVGWEEDALINTSTSIDHAWSAPPRPQPVPTERCPQPCALCLTNLCQWCFDHPLFSSPAHLCSACPPPPPDTMQNGAACAPLPPGPPSSGANDSDSSRSSVPTRTRAWWSACECLLAGET